MTIEATPPVGVPGVAPAVGAQPAAPAVGEPAWLKPRLDQARQAERNAVLAELGVPDVGAARTAVASAQRATALEQEAVANQARMAQLQAVVALHAGALMAGLTADQQTAVKKFAGEDPAKQMEVIQTFQTTWAATPLVSPGTPPPAPAPAPVPVPPGPTPVIAGATTAPPPSAPAGGAPPPAVDHRNVYASLGQQNPFAAAEYGAQHPEIYNPR